MPYTAIQIEIHGRVQGVGFRSWLRQIASVFELEGWVRNRHEGWVEAMLKGPTPRVDAAVVLIERGPPGSRVENVAVRPATPDESVLGITGFTVLADL